MLDSKIREDAERQAHIQEKALIAKADHLATIGTLTSLVSTAAYFSNRPS